MTGGRSGFTLVETLVALTLLAVGLTGTLGTVVLATRVHGAARLAEAATARAGEVADSVIRAGGGGGEADEGGWHLRWDIPPGAWGWVEATTTVSSRGGGGAAVRLEVRAPSLPSGVEAP